MVDLISITRLISLSIFTVTMVYEILRWSRPPLSLFIKQGFQAARLLGILKTTSELIKTFIGNFYAQEFIANRDRIRWISHFLMFLGSGGLLILHGLPRILLGIAENELFPCYLPSKYPVILFIVLILGTSMTMINRVILKRPPDVNLRVYDLLPLVMLATIGITGFLDWQLEYEPAIYENVDPILRRGVFFTIHMLTVYAILAVFPLTKFFHWLIRLLSIGVRIYQLEYQMIGMEKCKKCGNDFAPAQQVEDVKKIADDIRPDLFELCPNCRRKVELEELVYLEE